METNENKTKNNFEIVKENENVQNDIQGKAIQKSKVAECFNIVQKENGTYSVAMANYMVTEKEFETPKAADNYLRTRPYDVLINSMIVMNKLIVNNESKGNNN